ncbi:MAG TPA: RodZ domain-containing protein [Vicinamibacterales bacterium]|nr:RodZ domain-containing protein [Vicinamibacterales bacterium]
MEHVGSRLRKAREAKGLSLHEVAAVTKISIAALEALEKDDYTRLPGGIFGRSFVKAYAAQVGIDPEQAVAAFAADLARAEGEAAKRKEVPEVTADDRAFLERQRRAIRLVQQLGLAAGVLIVAGLAFWGWTRWGRQPPDALPVPEAAVVRAQPPPPSADPPAVQAAPAAPEKLAIQFEFSADCWVRIAADGQVVLERIIKAGEKQAFTADHEVALNVGNAGAFTWTLNGKPARSLGPSGTTRVVRITRENVDSFLQR